MSQGFTVENPNIDVALSTRATETTLISIRDYLDTVETKLQSLIDSIGQVPLNSWTYHEDSSNTQTDAVVKAAPGVGISIYITDISVSKGANGTYNFFLESAGTTKIFGPINVDKENGRGFVEQFKTPLPVAANTSLTITTSGAMAHSIDIQGFTK